jgi:plastocyanin
MKRLVFALVLLLMASATVLPGRALADDSGTSLELHALLLAFDKTSLSVPSGANVTVTLYNDENYIAHNVSIDLPDAVTPKACLGPCTQTLTFTAPAPGTYQLICTLHPTMTVDLYVQ